MRVTKRMLATTLSKQNLKKLKKSGMTYEEIGKKLHMTTAHIWYYFNKYNLTKKRT